MYGRLSKKKGVDVKGILLEKMVPKGGVELIVGIQNDPQFGPMIMAGLGGVMTEIFKDVAFRMLPITTSDAKSMLNELKGSKLLKGFRGSAPIDINMVAKMLVDIGKLGVENADYVNSIDFNPVIVYPKSYFVVDAKIILNNELKKNSISKAKPNITSMESFFTPKSVALVGASATPGKIGNSVLDALGKQDYKGKVYPINPKQESILGIKCYPSLDAIKDKVDLVINGGFVDDEATSYEMSQKRTILEASLDEDLDVPYSCQGGICSSCIARIKEGEATMRQNNILTDSEVAEGLILTCQAHPTTPTIVVDFDDV